MNDLNVFKYGYYKLFCFNTIKQFFRNIKYAYQRVTKGYCEPDILNFDEHLLALMHDMLIDLADTTHSYPGIGIFDNDQALNAGYKDLEYGSHGAVRWKAYLKEIADHLVKASYINESSPINKQIQDLEDEYINHIAMNEFIPVNSNYSKMHIVYDDPEEAATAKKKWLTECEKGISARQKELKQAFDMLYEYWSHIND